MLAPKNASVRYQGLIAGIVIQPGQLLHKSQSRGDMHTHTTTHPHGSKNSGGSVIRLSPRIFIRLLRQKINMSHQLKGRHGYFHCLLKMRPLNPGVKVSKQACLQGEAFLSKAWVRRLMVLGWGRVSFWGRWTKRQTE